jgi:hypothetical protein
MNKEQYDYWKNGPPGLKGAFNPDYKPYAVKVRQIVTDSMDQDDFYSTHTREECKVEWNNRYNETMKVFEKNT